MKHDVKKYRGKVLELALADSRIVTPFIIFAFFEILALIVIYFSPRAPLSYLFNPIVRKFAGEIFIHYPSNFLVLPKIFYYAKVAVYIFMGVFLSSVTVNMVKNLNAGLPIKLKAMIRNASNRYFAFVLYGALLTASMLMVKKLVTAVFLKITGLIGGFLPEGALNVMPVVMPIAVFIAGMVLYTVLISAIPIIVIKKSPLIRALIESARLGIRNFFTIFKIIFVPSLFYLPFVLLSSFSITAARKSCPEAIVLITLAGVIVSAMVECFIVICVSQFVLDNQEKAVKA